MIKIVMVEKCLRDLGKVTFDDVLVPGVPARELLGNHLTSLHILVV